MGRSEGGEGEGVKVVSPPMQQNAIGEGGEGEGEGVGREGVKVGSPPM